MLSLEKNRSRDTIPDGRIDSVFDGLGDDLFGRFGTDGLLALIAPYFIEPRGEITPNSCAFSAPCAMICGQKRHTPAYHPIRFSLVPERNRRKPQPTRTRLERAHSRISEGVWLVPECEKQQNRTSNGQNHSP